ncbi:Bifunctional monodehydroascorbate reductase and carbonic anhydrase nectarin-3 [Acorus calamus]|uniref:Carbonic anhydrase n=1 Tax=Acorus calamus TaxID=4465 RepID=A0AAV9DL09_ACOCL|nr:Bifunctional monodehydroascorbate reductase and carbonic anhydrase nectarin-3 [Acorus calamus]
MASRATTATAIGVWFMVFVNVNAHHYYACSSGKLQSPINIIKDNAIWNPKLEPLTRYYNSANGTLVDSGFNIQLRYDDSVGGLIIGGKNYTLKQMHWHTPSEHTIDGIRYPVELHLVHMSKDGDIAVVAILYNLGDPDPFLDQVRELSMDQLVELKAPLELAYKNNSRPTQPLNGRHVYLFDEKYPNNLFGSGRSSNKNNSDDDDDDDDKSVP